MTVSTFDPSRMEAVRRDKSDQLAAFRDQFVFKKAQETHEKIYMDGNSLGRLPKRTSSLIEEVVNHQWGEDLIGSWNNGWFSAPQRLGDKIGRLIGAGPGQVIACDTTSINLYKMVMAALSLRPDRTEVISDCFNFPSDLYIVQGCLNSLAGRHELFLVPSQDSITPDLDALYHRIGKNTALVTLSHVVFKSGFLYDAAEITRRVHEAGGLVIWDLSHSAGAVPVHLDEWDVDFAVGCTYKYLNGGPGAPAYLYVKKALQDRAASPIWGWFGQKSPFAFDLEYQPAGGIAHFLVSSPPVISLLAIEPGLDLLLEAGIDHLRQKSLMQGSYLIDLFDHTLAPLGFTLGSPRDGSLRGSHISIRHPDGYRINRALIEEMGVVPDFREPDNIRLGITPLYTTYLDIWETIDLTARVIREGRYEKYPALRQTVT